MDSTTPHHQRVEAPSASFLSTAPLELHHQAKQAAETNYLIVQSLQLFVRTTISSKILSISLQCSSNSSAPKMIKLWTWTWESKNLIQRMLCSTTSPMVNMVNPTTLVSVLVSACSRIPLSTTSSNYSSRTWVQIRTVLSRIRKTQQSNQATTRLWQKNTNYIWTVVTQCSKTGQRTLFSSLPPTKLMLKSLWWLCPSNHNLSPSTFSR